MIRVLAILGLAALIGAASAQPILLVGETDQVLCPAVPDPKPRQALVCWTNARKDVNGNLLPSEGPYSIFKTRLQRAKVGANKDCSFDTIAETLNFDPNTFTYTFKDLQNGKHCFRVRHLSHDEDGKELNSNWSKIGSKVVS